jgi:hypothetical protein
MIHEMPAVIHTLHLEWLWIATHNNGLTLAAVAIWAVLILATKVVTC